QVTLVARRAELCTSGCYGDELDRNEAIGQMHGEHCNRENASERHANERDECPDEHRKTAEEFNEYCHPCHYVRIGNAQGLKNGNKVGGTADEFGISMRHKSVADDKAQWDGCPLGMYETLKHGSDGASLVVFSNAGPVHCRCV